jgi:hypothetical protein
MTPALNAHANLLELFALLGREDFFDFGIGSIELTANLRLDAAHQRVDAYVMLIDDPLNPDFLLRCQMKFAIEMLDDAPGRELRPRAMPKKIEVIAGDADEDAADERRDHDDGRRRSRPTR